jgi:hypothetical protein
MHTARPFLPAPLYLAVVLVFAAVWLPAPARGTEPGGGKNEWDVYMNQMARIADENLSPVFQAVTQAANSFERTENLLSFSGQLESGKTELMTIQALMAGLNPPVQLLEADHYIRDGIQKLMDGLDILIRGAAGKQTTPALVAMENVTRGADFVVRGYGLLSEQSRRPTDLAQTP